MCTCSLSLKLLPQIAFVLPLAGTSTGLSLLVPGQFCRCQSTSTPFTLGACMYHISYILYPISYILCPTSYIQYPIYYSYVLCYCLELDIPLIQGDDGQALQGVKRLHLHIYIYICIYIYMYMIWA